MASSSADKIAISSPTTGVRTKVCNLRLMLYLDMSQNREKEFTEIEFTYLEIKLADVLSNLASIFQHKR